MFLGEYQHTLDAKGRVSLPSRFRNKLGETVTVAMGLDHSLYVFPPEDYEGFIESILSRSEFNPRVREVKRFFASGAVEAPIDSAGRVQLTPKLREWAGLTKDVTVIGSGDRIEMWDSAAWSAYNGETATDIGTLTQELSDAGLL